MRRIFVCAVALQALASAMALAADSELNLNYSDPKGVELALGLLQESGPPVFLDEGGQLSDTTASVLDVLGVQNARGTLDEVLTSKQLVRDEEAAKTIVVGLDATGAIEHVDLIGIVRGKDETLPAPDAVSRFVIRFSVDGDLSVIERKADANPHIDTMKFSFEK